MKKLAIYLVFLVVSSVIAFLLAFSVGRRPTLEQELARRTILEGRDESLRIKSLKSLEPEVPDEPEEEIDEPDVENVSEDVTITRYAAEEAGLVLLLDGGLLSAAGEYDFFSPRRFLPGLEGFFDGLPASLSVGLRSLSAPTAGDCGSGMLLRESGVWEANALKAALRLNTPLDGSRSIARGLEEAAAELAARPGGGAIVVVTAGDEECGGNPCRLAADLQRLAYGPPVFVVALGAPPGYRPAGAPAPPWQAAMECLAADGGGELYAVSSPEELKDALGAIVASLRPNVTVRAFHGGDREIRGASVEAPESWGATVSGSGRSVHRFPAAFSLPPGTVDIKVWYHGEERLVEGVELAAGERLDVLVNFRSGDLYIETKDAAGEDLAGDTSGLDCYWGVELFPADNPLGGAGSSCSFPAYFVLPPGYYTVRVWNGEQEHWLDDVQIREGKTTIEKVAFEEGGEAPVPPAPSP